MGNLISKDEFVSALKPIDKTKWGTYEDIMKNVKHADIIEVDRKDYRHFAMYVGTYQETDRGVCVHVYHDEESNKGKMHIQLLEYVIGDDMARINNKGHEARERQLSERKTEHQIDDAMRRFSGVTQVDFDFNVVTNNCEMVVTRLKYGEGFSKQVKNVISRALRGKINALYSFRSLSDKIKSVGGKINVKTQ